MPAVVGVGARVAGAGGSAPRGGGGRAAPVRSGDRPTGPGAGRERLRRWRLLGRPFGRRTIRSARGPAARFDFSRGLQEKCKNISFPFTNNNLPLILKNYFTDLHISQTITRLLPFTGILYVNEDRLGLHNRFPLKKALCGYFLLSGILVNCLVIIN